MPDSRREFLKTGTAPVLAACLAPDLLAKTPSTRPATKMIWANLLHLSYNMWCDWDAPLAKGSYANMMPDLRFDEPLWRDLVKAMADAGLNMVVIDLGDGVKYKSHPEIAVNGAWSTARLRGELGRLREKGLEPIPKLNFSATHDAWMRHYSRQLSTDPYYAVCRDLISEVIELFDKPRFFHLGMDEETAEHQSRYEYVVVRQHGLWWRDFMFLVGEARRGGARPWIWSDYLWHHREDFMAQMPRDVLQSNWYYATQFDRSVTEVEAYHLLDQHGYDQVPTGSNYSDPQNFELTVSYCRNNLQADRLLGFLQAPWRPTIEATRARHMQAIAEIGRARADWKE